MAPNLRQISFSRDAYIVMFMLFIPGTLLRLAAKGVKPGERTEFLVGEFEDSTSGDSHPLEKISSEARTRLARLRVEDLPSDYEEINRTSDEDSIT